MGNIFSWCLHGSTCTTAAAPTPAHRTNAQPQKKSTPTQQPTPFFVLIELTASVKRRNPYLPPLVVFRSGSASPVSSVPDPGMLNAMIRQGAPSMELFWVKTWVLTSPTYSSAARALFLRRPVCVWSLPPRSEWIH